MITMFKEYVKFAFGSFTHRKLRSVLTVVGIFIGIAAVVSLISIGNGLQDAIEGQFEQMGSNKIMVMPGAEGGLGMMNMFTASIILDNADLKVVKKVKGVGQTAEMLMKSASVRYRKQTKYQMVIGMPPGAAGEMFKDISGFQIDEGRELEDDDKYKVALGIDVSEILFDREIDIGDKLIIQGFDFDVVGIYGRVGNAQDDGQLYIPIDIARDIFEEEEEISTIMLEVKDGFDPSEVAEDIKDELRDKKDEEEGEESFQVQTSEQLMASVGDVLGIVQAVIIGIASISILVGGVGIMNTMYTTVLERTRDIGVMKAIGATNNDILLMFLIESGIVGLVGGSIGCILGIIMAKGVEIASAASGFEMLKASITPDLILLALGFSFVIGGISGVMPAKRAAELKPVDALRYE
jgi:putative ABC transport system permease protein